MTTIWFRSGPLDGQCLETDQEIADLPRYWTCADAVRDGAAFQLGLVYEKSMDNEGVHLGDGPQAEYTYCGDTASER